MEISKNVLLILIFTSLVQAKFLVSGPKKLFRDPEGYYRILHGANIAYKIAPYLPPIIDHYDPKLSFSNQDAIQLKNWGMNIVRLTFYWEGVEPKKGEYSAEYIASLKKIVEICQKHDIQVILDLHQDANSRYYCGEGIPDWAVERRDDFPKPLNLEMEFDDNGYPTIKSCLQTVFPNFYWSYGVQILFQDLYDNKRGIQDSFVDMWGEIAKNFKDYDNVIGYEIINEPWVGNLYEKPSRLLFGGDENLYPFYKRVHDKIREIDQKSIVFFENSLTDSVTLSLKKAPAAEKYKDRLMHSYHLYCSPKGDPGSNWWCNAMLKGQDFSFGLMRKMWNVGGFLSEFGAISGVPGPGIDTTNYVLDLAAIKFHSWTYWQYKYYNDYTTAARPSEREGYFDEDGNVQTDKVKMLARPYAHKICGEPQSTSWKDGVLSLEFKANKHCTRQTTHFYLSEEFHFLNGFKFEISGCEGCELEREAEKHWFFVDHSKAEVDGLVNIKITQK